MELHAFMIELLGTFEFSLEDNEEVRRESSFVMTPTVDIGRWNLAYVDTVRTKVMCEYSCARYKE